jgi:hypothetical protein
VAFIDATIFTSVSQRYGSLSLSGANWAINSIPFSLFLAHRGIKVKGVILMKKSLSFYSKRLGLLLLLSSGLALSLVPRCSAQSTSQDPQAPPSTSAPAPQTDAEKKAAERKKRFEEQKRLLDGGGSASAGATTAHVAATDSEFYINPIAVNMVANESQELHVWDHRGTGNDVSARVSWSLSGSGVVDMTVKHHAIVTAKMPGTVSVIGQIDGHTVEAIVTVYRGEKLPPGIAPYVSSPPPVRTGGRPNVQTVTVQP